MRINNAFILLIIGFLSATNPVFAQTDSTDVKKGEVIDGKIIIEKNKKILMPQADKIVEKSAIKPFSAEPMNLTFQTAKPELVFSKKRTDVEPEKYAGESLPLENQNYVKVGYGNYGSPLLAGGYFHELGKHQLGAEAKYESFLSGPVAGRSSGNSNAFVKAFGDLAFNNWEIQPLIQFANTGYHYYGSASEKFINDTIAIASANFNNFLATVNVSNTINNDFKVHFQPYFSVTSQKNKVDNSKNKEIDIGAKLGANTDLTDNVNVGMNLNAHKSNIDNGLEYSRHLLVLSPFVKYSKDKWNLRADLSVTSQGDYDGSNTTLFPNLSVSYQLSEQFKLFGAYESGAKWQTLNQLLTENPFVQDSISIKNITTNLGGRAGVEGNINKKVNVKANLSYRKMTNLPLFYASSDTSQFSIRYDSALFTLGFMGGLSYYISPRTLVNLEFTFNQYDLSSEQKAWHLPEFISKLNFSYTIKEKFTISSQSILLGGIVAPSKTLSGNKILPVIFDTSLKFSYLLNNHFNAFLSVDNLLGTEYQRYIGYPVRGITFKVGLIYSF